MSPSFRYRGGVAHDARGWYTIVELAGERYEGEVRFATEVEALEDYQMRVRPKMMESFAKSKLKVRQT